MSFHHFLSATSLLFANSARVATCGTPRIFPGIKPHVKLSCIAKSSKTSSRKVLSEYVCVPFRLAPSLRTLIRSGHRLAKRLLAISQLVAAEAALGVAALERHALWRC